MTDLAPEWTKIVTNGSKIVVDDGELRIRRMGDGQAHIQREVNSDNFTVTAKANFDSSVYISWGPGNWVGVGKLSPTPFGRFSTTVSTDGETSVVQHRGTNYHAMHLLRIELGPELIRFLYSNADKQNWQHLRTIERTGDLAGPPKLVSFGTRYTENPGPYGDPNSASDETTGPDRGATALDDIEIKPTSPASLSMTKDERKYLHTLKPEPVNALLTQSKEDPTYQQVASFYPAMKSPREIVGVPAHPLDIGVDYFGRIDVSPWSPPVAWLELGDPAKPFADNLEDISSRRLLDGSIPIVTLKKDQSGVRSELTVLGWSEEFSPGNDLFAYVRLSMAANDGVHLPQKIALAGQDDKRVEFEPEQINRGQLELYFKFQHPKPETAVEITREEFEAIHHEAAEMWKKRLAEGSRITTPDTRTNEMYKALLAYSLLNTDKVNGQLEPHDGAGFYDIAFGHSVSLYAMACDMFGMPNYVEAIHDMQISFQKEDGSYVQECGLVDLGSLLAALPRHYEITQDKEWLERVTPNIIKGCDWLLARRAEAPKSGVTKGLIKFRPYNDFPEPTFNYVGNTLSCVGLEECAKVLPLVGRNEEAEKFAAEAKQYREDIYASMEAAKFERNGMTILPIEPDTQRILKLSSYTGGEYYGLTASQMLGTEFFRPGDKFPQYLIDMLEKRGGIMAGVCEFQEGIDHAYTYGYLMSQLERNDPRKVILAHYSMMAYGMSQETYSPVEISMIKTGENHYTLPHLYSCTDHLRLLRNMLLREDGKNLIIGQAIPREWLEPGKKTEVTSAPTVFGPASYTMQSLDANTVQVNLEAPTRNAPEEIHIYLRHPSKKPVLSASTDNGAEVRTEGERITLTGTTKPTAITVKF